MNYELGIKNKIKVFTDLTAWQKGHELVLLIYKATKSFPKEELFSLTNQIRRAAVSITSNIAEGFSRQGYADKIRFYSMAQGSVTEVQNQIFIARDIGYIKREVFDRLYEQLVVIHKIINGLIKKSKTIRDS